MVRKLENPAVSPAPISHLSHDVGLCLTSWGWYKDNPKRWGGEEISCLSGYGLW